MARLLRRIRFKLKNKDGCNVLGMFIHTHTHLRVNSIGFGLVHAHAPTRTIMIHKCLSGFNYSNCLVNSIGSNLNGIRWWICRPKAPALARPVLLYREKCKAIRFSI